MNIAELAQKGNVWREGLKARIRSRLASVPRDVLFVLVLILCSSASFGLGMLAEREFGQGSPFSIKEIPLEEMPAAALAAPTAEPVSLAPAALRAPSTEVIASKNGTKYYYASCGGVSRISAANRVTFSSATEAEAKGYTLAANCSAP